KQFEEMKNPKGRYSIWKLDTIQGLVIASGTLGLSSIDSSNTLRYIDGPENRNIRNFIMPSNNPNIILGSAPFGFSIYKKTNGEWKYDGSTAKFNEYARHIYEDSDGSFVVSDKSKGIFRVRFNDTYDTVIASKKYNADEGGLPSNIENYIFNTGNGLAVGTLDGFYKYDPDSDKYVAHENLNKAFGGKKVYDMMYNDGIGNLWVKHVVSNKRDENIRYWMLERYTMLGDTSAKLTEGIFRPYMSRINTFGYIGNGCYIIGDKDGFVMYDDRIVKQVDISYNALISKIENIYNDSLIYGGNAPEQKIVLPYSQRSIRVLFAATSYEHPESIKFKSYLENNDDEWSDFRSETYKEYPTLSPGKYILHVKAINIYNVESQEATITIEILPPWYLTIWAKIFYVLLFGLLIWAFIKAYTKKLIRDKEKLEQIVEERTAEIRKQSQLILEKNQEITAKNKEITDSIKYAQRIQTAMLPMEEKIQAAIPDHFILFRPKDIVSGDYYWYAETEQSVLITAADCTGHGVPGAFMSMIGSQILTEIVVEGITSPEEILTNQNRRIRKALKQDTTANQDGMDMALCRIDKKTHLVEYAGAKNQLVVIQNGELTEYKADKQSIGGQQLYGDDFQYKKVAIQPDGNTWFYMFSDGYKDQFGGANNSKFLIKNLRALLLKIHTETPEKQREILNDTIEKWIADGHTEQTDDIILIGFKC
ncbi:MAG: SpoIIE family protein phosphatase, partial [Bacteroidales bacterium]|nr:SpoIIE family protein phosphatase [Bacteroidales bacterium]